MCKNDFSKVEEIFIMFTYSKLPDSLKFAKLREFPNHYPDAYAWVIILNGAEFINSKEKPRACIDVWIKAESDVMDSCGFDEFLNPEMDKLLKDRFIVDETISYLIKISYNSDKNDFESSLCYNEDNEIIIRKWNS